MEIGTILKSLKVKQCKEICIILQHADFLEWLFLQIVLILFQRQPMEALVFQSQFDKSNSFYFPCEPEAQKLIHTSAFRFLQKALVKEISDLPKTH